MPASICPGVSCRQDGGVMKAAFVCSGKQKVPFPLVSPVELTTMTGVFVAKFDILVILN